MSIIKNTIYETKSIKKVKDLLFDVDINVNILASINRQNSLNFNIGTSEAHVMIELDREIYRIIRHIYVNDKKIYADFYYCNIYNRETSEHTLLSGIVIPNFELTKWNNITIVFKKQFNPTLYSNLSQSLKPQNDLSQYKPHDALEINPPEQTSIDPKKTLRVYLLDNDITYFSDIDVTYFF